MGYSTITNGEIDQDSPLTTGLVTKLRDNPEAIASGAVGAPKVQASAINTTGLDADQLDGQEGSFYQNAGNLNAGTVPLARLSGITGTQIANDTIDTQHYIENSVDANALGGGVVSYLHMQNDAIRRAQIYTDIGEVSTSNQSYTNLTLPGGEYGFYPQVKISDSDHDMSAQIAVDGSSEAYLTNIALSTTEVGVGTRIGYAQQRYILSSPPFNLGDGDIPLFVFFEVNPNGDIVSGYSAMVPPWAYNGPTKIDADYIDIKTNKKYKKRVNVIDKSKGEISVTMEEVTQDIKNKDMVLIPHPFRSSKPENTIVLVDPPNTGKLFDLHEAGESVLDLFNEKYVSLDNAPLNRATPSGVKAHKFKWKSTI